MRARSSFTYLVLSASLPLVVTGGSAIPLLALGGCSCDEGTTVFAIEQAEYTSLSKQYGFEALPQNVCVSLCIDAQRARADAGVADAGDTDAGDAGADAGDVGGGELAPESRLTSVSECKLVTIDWTEPAVICTGTPDCGGSGRRPPGLEALDETGTPRDVGEHFARAARLEAASVAAFADLAIELALHGAPRALIDAALSAAGDEIDHARTMARLARRAGARPHEARVRRGGARSLDAIAIDNAVEGCVHEAFGAALIAHQAGAARDPAVRAALRSIAEDEGRHAAFSRRLDAWLASRVGNAVRRRARLAREDAVGAIEQGIGEEPTHSLARVAGLPSATRTASLFAAMRPRLLV